MLATMGISIRNDLFGVSSIMRALGLNSNRAYYSIVRLFHSSAVNLQLLTNLWIKICLNIFSPFTVRYNDRLILLVDGIKVPKEGRRMPGVKKLFQSSSNNSKPKYIWGHSCQGISLLARGGISFIAIPLVQRIQEGIGDTEDSIVQKVIDLIKMTSIDRAYLIGDAYYFSGKLCGDLIKIGTHLISRARSNAVAYRPVNSTNLKKGRGRPKKYGEKVKIKHLFRGPGFEKIRIKLYDKIEEIEMKAINLISKSHKDMIRYVLVKMPSGPMVTFISTDINLSGQAVIERYAKRFKIEVSFKEMVHRIGTFSYRFWSNKVEKSRKLNTDKRDPQKEKAYHLYIQMAIIAHGMISYLSLINSGTIWKKFDSWLRTINPNMVPSTQIVMMALREDLNNFYQSSKIEEKFKKFYLKTASQLERSYYHECG